MSYRFIHYEIEGYTALDFVGPDELDEYYIPLMIERRRNQAGDIDYAWMVGYPCDLTHQRGEEPTMRKAKKAAIDAAILLYPELEHLLKEAKKKA